MPVKILIVDDNPNFNRAVTLLLDHTKYLKVIHSISFTDDVKMQIEVIRPQLILLDMGKLDFTRMALMKSAKKLIPKLLVISLSDQDSPAARQSSMVAGSDDFIPKGDVITQLVPVIQRLLREKDIKPVS